jgi:hypothetical protein
MERTFFSDGAGESSLRVLDVRADDTDTRDYLYSPSLDLLPEAPHPPERRFLKILDQGQEGACVGFALGTVINISLARRRHGDAFKRGWVSTGSGGGPNDEQLVSERMLYEMGKRHDEWEGEHYEGTSPRGAMKGWHKHGVCARKRWPYNLASPGYLSAARRKDALSRPLGSYYRVVDSDVSHIQAAVYEGDAVLGSGWVHGGWRNDKLKRTRLSRSTFIQRIPYQGKVSGLHAFAIVGYHPAGFIVQNSWGEDWGTGGLALLGYDDWFENRQDAWVARPGSETRDDDGNARIFLGGFEGSSDAQGAGRAGTAGADGLNIDPRALSHIVNTGDKGELSTGGRLRTEEDELAAMARTVRLATERNNGRDVVLYAHGGLNGETFAARRAGHLWKYCYDLGLTSYYFVWETGKWESLLGMIRSQDDASGPRAGLRWGALNRFLRDMKDEVRKRLRESQKGVGDVAAELVRKAWDEMKGRARGASTRNGGAQLFARELFKEMQAMPGKGFRVHLYAHSAGSIYLAWLYDSYLRKAIKQSNGKVRLGSVQFFAPAITIDLAKKIFVKNGTLPLPKAQFRIHYLRDKHEESDNIGVYPSSLLTYVADHLEDARKPVHVLGLRKDLFQARQKLGNPTTVKATKSEKHGEFDDDGHELELELAKI